MFQLLFPLLLPPVAHASEQVETAFVLSSQGVVDLAWDRPREDRLELWTRLRGQASGRAGADGRGRWWLAVLGQHAVLAGNPDTGGDLEAAWELRPWESGWEGPIAPDLRLKAGHLVERWGRLDLLPVTDVLMGRDLRLGPLTPPELLRQPAPLLRLQANASRARAELTVLPVGARDQVALEGTDWALLRQGQLSRLVRQASTWEGDALSTELQQQALSALADGIEEGDDQLRRALGGALSQSGRPRPLDEALDVGLRLEAEPGRWDLAAVGAWMRSRRPLPRIHPALVGLIREERLPTVGELEPLLDEVSDPFTTRWPRSLLAGVEAGTVVGPVGLRAEGLWRQVQVVPRRWMQAGTSPTVAAGLGLDWAHGTSVVLLGELRWEHFFELPPDAIFVAGDNLQVAVGGRFSFAGDRLGLEPLALYDPVFDEHALRAGGSWRLSDAWELRASALVLGGGPLSQSRRPPRSFQESVTWNGGPLGAWGDNDSATLELRWIR